VYKRQFSAGKHFLIKFRLTKVDGLFDPNKNGRREIPSAIHITNSYKSKLLY